MLWLLSLHAGQLVYAAGIQGHSIATETTLDFERTPAPVKCRLQPEALHIAPSACYRKVSRVVTRHCYRGVRPPGSCVVETYVAGADAIVI